MALHWLLLFQLAAAAVVVLAASYARGFWKNYAFARATGLPCIISPINPLSPFWLALQATMIVPVRQLLQRVPGRIGRDAEFLFPSWHLHDKTKIHNWLGKTFFQVTPTRLYLHVGDPDQAYDVLNRWKEFRKLRELYGAMAYFGENLTTVEGHDWQRHRKLTAPSFNESSSIYVWEESIRQGRAMLNLRHSDGAVTNKLEEDCRDIALHVLCHAGFNVQHEFGQGVANIPEGHTMSLRDSLMRVVRSMVIIYLIPLRVLLHAWAPKEWQVTGQSVLEFRKYMHDAVQDEREKIASKQPQQRDTFYGALVRAQSHEAEAEKSSSRRTGLDDSEVYGNVYVFNTAGHDTTANTLLFAFAILSLEPQWQDWVGEELSRCDFTRHAQDYETMYPQLVRCRALMLETTRLYGPVCFIPKATDSTRTVSLGPTPSGGQADLPPGTGVFINVKHLASDPDTWGDDADEFRPSRWIETLENDQEVVRSPPHPGAFLAWGAGARNCPGKKFSQVEFVAVVAAVLAEARVEPALAPEHAAKLRSQCVTGEAALDQQARQHLREVLAHVMLKFTVALERPHDLYIKWRRI